MTHYLRRMVFAVLVYGAGWFITAAGQEPAGQLAPTVPDEVIVQFRPQAAQARRDAIVAARGGRVLRRLESLAIQRVRLASPERMEADIAALQNDPDVVAVQPNFIREITAVPNDPHWASNSLWGLLKIQAASAWSLSTGSSQIVVADIDTGVNYTHPDLAQNMWRNPGEIAANGKDDDSNGHVDDVYGIDTYNGDSNPMDDHSHGTHTAGTIGGVGNNSVGVAGVNWNVRILACKAFNASGSGTDWAAIECFDYITALKKKGVNIRVSSNSWGSARGTKGVPQAMKTAIDAAGAAGILNVFAAGNSGTNNDSKPFDPASIDSASIVSVAASDSLDNRASFSNYGATSVDLAAPGVSILSTGLTGYVWKSGTSMATPHVAGAAALVGAIKPALTVSGIKTLLMSSADQPAAWNGKVASDGRLNLFLAALDAGGDVAPSVSLTSPVNGSKFTAPATTTVSASASDPDGTVAKVSFFANGILIATDTTSPYAATWSSVQAGQYAVTAVATDNRGFTATSATASITVAAVSVPLDERVNVALHSNGASVTASSTHSSTYSEAYAIDGNRRATTWGTTWADKTSNAYPDWIRVDFGGARTIGEIDVFTGQGDGSVDPTLTMTSANAIRNFQVQYWTGTQWSVIPGGAVTGNARVWRQFVFAPITTTAIRVSVTLSGGTLSRVAELEAYATGVTPPPPPSSTRVNVAKAGSGGSVTASSTYSAGYATTYANDGNRRASLWANTWADQTSGVFPDWLQVNFSGSKTINEIDVFSGQGGGTVDPTATLISTNAITDFLVQYWNGSTWAVIPNGSVVGNQLVWRKFTFPQITTTRIRIFVTRSTNSLSRIAEVEAYQVATTASSTSLIGFPPDNWWNLDISNAPVDPKSAAFISFINNGSVRRLHPDFGGNAPTFPGIYGMPYVVVDSTVPKKAVKFYYSTESDGVNHQTNVSFPFYPIPDAAITQPRMIEGGYPGNVDRRGIQDRHLLIVDKDNRHLYELYNVYHDGTKWLAASGAFFDMDTNNRRPENWTSADAAGLAILPGLVRYEEAFGNNEIRHAFRVTVRATNGYVFPASHRTGSTGGALPMGARLRLKANKDLSAFPPELQRIFRAMKRYGLIVADNGTDMFITGAYDPRWSNDILNPAFRALTASDFEVITLGYQG